MKCKIYKITLREGNIERTVVVPAQNAPMAIDEFHKKSLSVEKCEYVGWFLVDIRVCHHGTMEFQIHFDKYKTIMTHKDFGYRHLKERFKAISKPLLSAHVEL
jgi:hypothetical protein